MEKRPEAEKRPGVRNTESDWWMEIEAKVTEAAGARKSEVLILRPPAIVGDGAVFTSVNDVLAWDRNFYDNKLGAGDADLMVRWLAPFALPDGTMAGGAPGDPGAGYAMQYETQASISGDASIFQRYHTSTFNTELVIATGSGYEILVERNVTPMPGDEAKAFLFAIYKIL